MIKCTLSVCLIILSFGIFSQEKKDSTENIKAIDRIFYQDSTKHSHILDFEIVFLEPNFGALGYNYFHRFNKWISIGPRIGIWGFKTGTDIPPESARSAITYSLTGMANVLIWKSINAEFGAGYANYVSWPSKTNLNADGAKFEKGWMKLKGGVNFTLFNRIFLRGGVEYKYDIYTHNWNSDVLLSIGYKF